MRRMKTRLFQSLPFHSIRFLSNSLHRFRLPDSGFQIYNSRFGNFRELYLFFAILLITAISPIQASTPGFDTLVNYDTAWIYVYNGGKTSAGTAVNDIFFDVQCLTNGASLCVGQSGDTANSAQSFFIRTVLDMYYGKKIILSCSMASVPWQTTLPVPRFSGIIRL
jgi:hypothetical protein